ncbi:MAG TPA: hypothetical protein VHE81_06530 [Lacipirellulaceae bacterium]|nr:hypothetical protein [Lacipirellulaceae bacterium]
MADDTAPSQQSPVDATALNEIATNGALLNQNLSELTKAVGSLASIVLPVTNGGTNKSSFTAYAPICGGTTTTGALQSVASVGTAGQLLTSNGAGALPTFETFVDGIGGLFAFPDNGVYKIWLNSPFSGTVTSTTTICTSGSCTATFRVNTSSMGGPSNSVSTSEQTISRTSSNTFNVGDDLTILIQSNSSCQGMSFMISYTRP